MVFQKAPKPRTLARMAGLVSGTRPSTDANELANAAAILGPAPFLDPFARARRAKTTEATA